MNQPCSIARQSSQGLLFGQRVEEDPAKAAEHYVILHNQLHFTGGGGESLDLTDQLSTTAVRYDRYRKHLT